MIAIATLAVAARKLGIAYPIPFVIGGLVLGMIPGLPQVHLNPDLVFLIFLPPLIYPAALFTSWRDFRANLRPISMLAIRLVIISTVVIGYSRAQARRIALGCRVCFGRNCFSA